MTEGRCRSLIRSRKPATDDRAIVRLIRRQLLPLNPPELRPKLSYRNIVRRVNAGTTYVWAPDEAASPALRGFITLQVRGDELFVDMLALDDAVQGRGVGGQLLRRAERFGAHRSCRVMRLYVNDDNVRGIRFYQKQGMYVVWHDRQLRSYVMEKPIG
ncbi:GNAT family N-acetyltransferase [Paenibacillus sp. TRM 82003]|nr:GNAT family N-acetyltransferase [Paenibacillus sp. TRM 82003]